MLNREDVPKLPLRIHRLAELAYDLWWTWHPEARQVFRLLDYRLWRRTSHNPVRMLHQLAPGRLEAAARDAQFLAAYELAVASLDTARTDAETWWNRRATDRAAGAIAYFSAEFALHQSLPIYAGGLGVLAGDHCKEASDLGVPIVGVGFMYPQGYFHQRMSLERGQEEVYETLDWTEAPIVPAVTPQGTQCVVSVPVGDRIVLAKIWRVQVGRVSVHLLDTQLEENTAEDRELSARLYGGGADTRLRQEIVLGVGGVRALRAMNLHPRVWHLNEGHAAFVALERLCEACSRGETIERATDGLRRTTVFTTHTPVAAGHDAFPIPMVEGYLRPYWRGGAAFAWDAFCALGAHDDGGGPRFNMTALALRTSARVNGVSRRHGEVSRAAWEHVKAAVSPDGPPIASITNGVHVPTWLAPDMARLFERRLGADWLARHDDPLFWDRLLEVPDEDLWEVHQALRHHLFWFIRERARQLWAEGRLDTNRVAASGVLLDPEALTIGYARRFTGYKRPELLFHDSERLARLLASVDRPVQIVFAGKSHPNDYGGKGHLNRVFARAVDPRFGGRIAFLEDYDLHVAHFLVQGCDVWLNTPLEPLEASGTSGMKAAMNGVLHLSVGDGWWAEGYSGGNGWLIRGDTWAGDPTTADRADASAVYDLLEQSVVPMFFERDAHGIPRRWIRVMKESIRTTVPRFSARRMLKDYVAAMYGPALHDAAESERDRELAVSFEDRLA
jgi:starch phosphorylase